MIGFILVTVGIIILALSSSVFEGGFVFVFPFFFFGSMDSLGIIPILGMMIIMAFFFFLMIYNWISFKHIDDVSLKEPYIKYDATCFFCGESIPCTARYCPSCGQDQEEGKHE
jgi:hypothetical protein